MRSKKIFGPIILVVLVAVGAALYFFVYKPQTQQVADTNKTPASKFPAKEHIMGIETTSATLDDFMKTEYDRQNADCQKTTPGAELAMGVTKTVGDSFAMVALGCGDNGTAGYYAKVNGGWQLAFKSNDTPACTDVNNFKFTKAIIPMCDSGGGNIVANTNP